MQTCSHVVKYNYDSNSNLLSLTLNKVQAVTYQVSWNRWFTDSLLKCFGSFGAPYQLRSDNGPHFIAHVIREFLLLFGVTHCLTLAYSKEVNATVKRYNKEINRHLRVLTFENLSLADYKKSLSSVQRISNSNHSDR